MPMLHVPQDAPLRGPSPVSSSALRAMEEQVRELRAEHEALRRCLDRAGIMKAADFDHELRAILARDSSTEPRGAKDKVDVLGTTVKAVSKFKRSLSPRKDNGESNIPSPSPRRRPERQSGATIANPGGIPVLRMALRSARETASKPRRISAPAAAPAVPAGWARGAGAVNPTTAHRPDAAPAPRARESTEAATLERQWDAWNSRLSNVDTRSARKNSLEARDGEAAAGCVGSWEPWESGSESAAGEQELAMDSPSKSVRRGSLEDFLNLSPRGISPQPSEPSTASTPPTAGNLVNFLSGKAPGKGPGKGKGPGPPPPKGAGSPLKADKPKPSADKGAIVEVQGGMHAGKRATVLRVSGEGKEMRWRVQIDGGPSTWVDAVTIVEAAATADKPAAETPAEPSSPPIAPPEVRGKAPGKGPGKGKGPGPPPPKGAGSPLKADKPKPSADKGAIVEVQGGVHAGKRATVLKVSGEGKEMRWRVQIDGGPSTWVDAVTIVEVAATAAKLQAGTLVVAWTEEASLSAGRLGPGESPPCPSAASSAPLPAEGVAPVVGSLQGFLEQTSADREPEEAAEERRDPAMQRSHSQRDLMEGPSPSRSWECPECGVLNENGAESCSLCGYRPDGQASRSLAGDDDDDREREEEEERDGLEEDAEEDDDEGEEVDEDVLSARRLSCIDEDQLKYFDSQAVDAFASPLPDMSSMLEEEGEPTEPLTCLADEFEDGECF